MKGEAYKGDAGRNAQYAFSKAGLKKPLKLAEVGALPMGTKGALTSAARPLMVTFDDITKPETVKRIPLRGLSVPFGPGYALKSITLEITNEPVTEGRVEVVLGWWCDYRAKYLVDRYAEQVTNEFAREVGGSHFKTGECR